MQNPYDNIRRHGTWKDTSNMTKYCQHHDRNVKARHEAQELARAASAQVLAKACSEPRERAAASSRAEFIAGMKCHLLGIFVYSRHPLPANFWEDRLCKKMFDFMCTRMSAGALLLPAVLTVLQVCKWGCVCAQVRTLVISGSLTMSSKRSFNWSFAFSKNGDHRRSLTDDGVEMETLLRVNGSFMEFMKEHYPDEEKAHHMQLIETFSAAESAVNSTRSTAQPQPADQASSASTVGHG